MRLPNGDRAELETKLEDYSLNADHPRGKHKARVFAKYGITLDTAAELRAAVIEAAADSALAVSHGDNGFGKLFELRFPLPTDAGTPTVLSVWIVRHGEDFPRLVTCYIV